MSSSSVPSHPSQAAAFATAAAAFRLDARMTRWALVHAVLLLAATAAALATDHLGLVLGAAALSFAGLIGLGWRQWTPQRHFGWANATTTLRLVLLGVIALWQPTAWGTLVPTGLIGVALLVSDGLDGWLARRRGEASAFGAFLDKEVDAFLLLGIVLILIQNGYAPVWLVAVGALRYAYVLVQTAVLPDVPDTYRNRWARVIYVVVVSCVLGCFLPWFLLPAPYAAIAPLVLASVSTLLLGASFAHSFAWLFRTRLAQRSARARRRSPLR